MKRTLLQMVQSILSDMDSEPVNSINDSIEAQQIASVIEDTYFNMISARMIPEHRQLLKITSLSNNQKPTHFRYPDRCKEIVRLSYNVDTSGGIDYEEIKYLEPLEFLDYMGTNDTNTINVLDQKANTTLIIKNDRMPRYYTSFDDLHIVMDAYDADVESTLQASKTQAYGIIYPVFSIFDSFQPSIDDNMLPYLLAEAKSVCFSLFKSGSDPKIEQASRRLKSYSQNDMYRTRQANKKTSYGRFGPNGVRHG